MLNGLFNMLKANRSVTELKGSMLGPKKRFGGIQFLFFILIVFTFWILRGQAKFLAVVEFKSNSDSVPTNFDESLDALLRTEELTFCFRYVFKSIPRYILFKTKQLTFSLYNNRGYIYMKSWNASTGIDEEYRRMFRLCKPYMPGHWTSMCLSLKLRDNVQELVIFQDGDLCFEKSFLDGDFQWIYLKPALSVNDL